ncbi:DUF6318 domain-containing protein [Nocardioides marinus]
MRKTVRHAVAQGLAAGLILTLSACGGDPEPRFKEEPSPTPSEVSSSAPIKEAWEEKSPEGAMAFAEHWVAELNAASLSGDTAGLQSVSATDCSSCASLIKFIDETYAGGGEIRGGDWRLSKLNFSSPDEGQTVAVGGTMKIPAQTVVTPEGQRQESAALEADYFFTLSWRQGWQVDVVETRG